MCFVYPIRFFRRILTYILPFSATHHTQVTTSAPADPFQMVNARLDAIERQMAEFQSVRRFYAFVGRPFARVI